MKARGRAARGAPSWRRLLADALDLGVTAASLALLWALGVLRPTLPQIRYDLLDTLATTLADPPPPLIGLLTLAAALGTAYGMLLRALVGQTLGEAALGLRLVDRHGFPPGPLHTLGHALFTALALAPAGLGYTWAFVDPNRQGLAEYLSATRLIYGRPFRAGSDLS